MTELTTLQRDTDHVRSSRLLTAPVQQIVAPLWLGAEQRGADLGAGVIAHDLRARWHRRQELSQLRRLLPDTTLVLHDPVAIERELGQRRLGFLNEVRSACEEIATATASSIDEGQLAVVLGGDHAVAAGSIAGAARSANRLGLLWFDAHPDLNTPRTSPSGHIHGMALAATLGAATPDLPPLVDTGAGLQPERICLLGIRDIDPGERRLIAELGIWMLTMEEWFDLGLIAGLDAALDHLGRQGVDAVHISFDVDVLDPVDMPGTGTTVCGGLTFREASSVLRRLRTWDGPVRSLDWVELNPLLDRSGRSVETAVWLLSTLLGESIR
jgi:arginase